MIDLRQAGAALREIREMARLKQTDVAAHLGVSDGAVSQWESGRVELKPSQLQGIAELVGLDFDAMLFKLGYSVTDDARERYAKWLLSRYAQPGAPIRASATLGGAASSTGGNRAHSGLKGGSSAPLRPSYSSPGARLALGIH